MKDPVFPRDRALTTMSLIIGILIWAGVVAAIIHFGNVRALMGG